MLFLIRETLIIHWGKNISVFDSKKKEVKVSETCRDFVNCEYCKADKARLAKATKNGKNGTSTTVTDEPSPLAVQKA